MMDAQRIAKIFQDTLADEIGRFVSPIRSFSLQLGNDPPNGRHLELRQLRQALNDRLVASICCG